MSNKQLTEDELKTAIKLISDSGISLFAGNDIEGGMFEVDVNQAIKYIENSEQFFADKYGVSIETVREYKATLFNYDRRCSAITTKNKQCNNFGQGWRSIEEFDKDRSNLCRLHSKANL